MTDLSAALPGCQLTARAVRLRGLRSRAEAVVCDHLPAPRSAS